MDVILGLLSTIFDVTVVGGIIVFIVKFIEFRRNLGTKNEMLALQAKVSMMRISLKSRVKKKANSFRSKFVKPINTGDPMDIALGDLTENKFENGEDFQTYFDLSKRINTYINTELQLTSDMMSNGMTSTQFEDFMGPDFKNEMAIVRLIKEMTDASAKHNAKVESYNKANPKAKMPMLDPLIFTSLAEVNRIFRNEVEKQDASTAALPVDHYDAA